MAIRDLSIRPMKKRHTYRHTFARSEFKGVPGSRGAAKRDAAPEEISHVLRVSAPVDVMC